MIQHEGKKYLKPIWGWREDGTRAVLGYVDIYDVIVAFGVTCPGLQQALKKIAMPGQRGKGDVVADLKGADAALQRARQLAQEAIPTPDGQTPPAAGSPRKREVKRNANRRPGPDHVQEVRRAKAVSDENTKIEWTHRRNRDGTVTPGFTFNPWIGCVKVSPACKNCYAERDMVRYGSVVWGTQAAGGTRPRTSNDNWRKPEKWAREAVAAGTRPLVFTASIADVGEEYDGPVLDHKGNVLLRKEGSKADVPHPFLDGPGVPLQPGWHAVLSALLKTERQGYRLTTLDDVRDDLFTLIGRTAAGLDWLVLSKRPDVLARQWPRLAAAWREGARVATLDPRAKNDAGPRRRQLAYAIEYYDHTGMIPNVWAGTTIEDQEWADRRLVWLAEIPTPRHFVSVEPQVGPITLQGDTPTRVYNWLEAPPPSPQHPKECRGVHWVISGGESGQGARPAHPQWYRDLRDQCQKANVPFHFKQWGEWLPVSDAPLDVLQAKEDTYQRHDVFPDGKDYFTEEDKKAIREGRYPLPVLTYRVGKKKAGRLLDDVEWHQTPESVL